MISTTCPRILGRNTGRSRSAVIVSAVVMAVPSLAPPISGAVAVGPAAPRSSSATADASRGPSAAVRPVELGDAMDCTVMAGRAVTARNKVTVTGDLNVTPGTFVSGFPPGQVRGSMDLNNAEAQREMAAAAAAYNDAASRTPTATVPAALGNGSTMTSGVYRTPGGNFTLSGTLHLDAQANPDATFIFQATSLVAERVSNIDLVNGAQADNVIWQVGDSATLGRYATFRGNLMAANSIAVTTGTAMYGRTIALHNMVTIDGTTSGPATRITAPDDPPTTTTLTSSPNPSQQGDPVTFTATVHGNVDSFLPTGVVSFKDGATVIGSAPLNSSAVATFTTSALLVGPRQITAVYVSGGTAVDDQWVHFAPSQSPVLVQQVLNRGS
ncbi:ice-binding family protein [Sphaerisporangium sp. NPDC049002]|uniref:ice-binding family protein n=1 Tax=unclassified Sphaerisporangium TaxID=2630420 RepID=UPI00340A011B